MSLKASATSVIPPARAKVAQTCPAPTSFAPQDGVSKASQPLSATDGVMVRNPFRENRVMRRD